MLSLRVILVLGCYTVGYHALYNYPPPASNLCTGTLRESNRNRNPQFEHGTNARDGCTGSKNLFFDPAKCHWRCATYTPVVTLCGRGPHNIGGREITGKHCDIGRKKSLGMWDDPNETFFEVRNLRAVWDDVANMDWDNKIYGIQLERGWCFRGYEQKKHKKDNWRTKWMCNGCLSYNGQPNGYCTWEFDRDGWGASLSSFKARTCEELHKPTGRYSIFHILMGL